MTDEEFKELVASLAIKSDRLDAQIQETNATLKRVGVDFGNMKKNQGDIAEEFFFNSLLDDPHLGGIHFDDIVKSQFKHRGNLQEEYDIAIGVKVIVAF